MSKDYAKERLDIRTGIMENMLQDIDNVRKAIVSLNERISLYGHLDGHHHIGDLPQMIKIKLETELLLYLALKSEKEIIDAMAQVKKVYERTMEEERKYREQQTPGSPVCRD